MRACTISDFICWIICSWSICVHHYICMYVFAHTSLSYMLVCVSVDRINLGIVFVCKALCVFVCKAAMFKVYRTVRVCVFVCIFVTHATPPTQQYNYIILLCSSYHMPAHPTHTSTACRTGPIGLGLHLRRCSHTPPFWRARIRRAGPIACTCHVRTLFSDAFICLPFFRLGLYY